MKIGDMVRLKKSGSIGLIVDKFRRCVPDGNPNGDFNIVHTWQVQCADSVVNIRQRDFFKVAEIIYEDR